MEEMEKAFNLTTTALIDTTRIADERDLKYVEQLILVESRLEKLENTVEMFNSFLEDLKVKVLISALKYKNKNFYLQINLRPKSLSGQ